MPRVMVIGATGLVGNALLRTWTARSAEVPRPGWPPPEAVTIAATVAGGGPRRGCRRHASGGPGRPGASQCEGREAHWWELHPVGTLDP